MSLTALRTALGVPRGRLLAVVAAAAVVLGSAFFSCLAMTIAGIAGIAAPWPPRPASPRPPRSWAGRPVGAPR
ncbi:hypothetical protein ACIA8I_25735 [Streptomyces rishiriensis]|uniref:hypothetical protein n=1 Tax=Streptomyces rishiriensis TaxID=68264 RepID=UPI0037AC7902